MQRRKTIVLIDDDPLVLETTQASLEEWGYRVFTVREWPKINEALTTAGEVDLVLIDVSMPALGGERLVPILRGYLAKGTPVLLFSGLPERELGKIAAECGADGYVSKKESSARLLVTLARKLGNRRIG